MDNATNLRGAISRAIQQLEGLAARSTAQGDHLGAASMRATIDALNKANEESKPTAREMLLAAQNEAAKAGPSMRFVVATPPSSKNSRKLAVIGGRPRMYRPAEVVAATEAIQRAAVAALKRQAPRFFSERRPLLLDDDAAVEMVHNVANETLDVTVTRRGPKPKGTTGRKRDVTNLPELVLDAIQRIAYANDNQVCDLRVWRNIGTPTTDGDADPCF